ncbi:MAG: alpha/beta hydrolase family protein [Verrucomicrobiota bacterium]
MFACLTKPLDWMAIKLATRCVKICPPLPSGTARPASSLDLNVIGSADQRPAIDIACAADGSFTFASPVKTPAARNNTVYGKLYPISSDWPQRPTVILLHGWNAELCYYRLFPYLAELLGSARINTLTFELPYHMQRRPRQGPVTDFISSDVPAMIEATRQAVAEIRGLCRWISEQGPGGVGLWGFSLGAWLAGLVLRAEEGL